MASSSPPASPTRSSTRRPSSFLERLTAISKEDEVESSLPPPRSLKLSIKGRKGKGKKKVVAKEKSTVEDLQELLPKTLVIGKSALSRQDALNESQVPSSMLSPQESHGESLVFPVPTVSSSSKLLFNSSPTNHLSHKHNHRSPSLLSVRNKKTSCTTSVTSPLRGLGTSHVEESLKPKGLRMGFLYIYLQEEGYSL